MVTGRGSRSGTFLLSRVHCQLPGGIEMNLFRNQLCAHEEGNPAFLCLSVEFLYCDLASLESVRGFAHEFKEKKIPLHVLVNNGESR